MMRSAGAVRTAEQAALARRVCRHPVYLAARVLVALIGIGCIAFGALQFSRVLDGLAEGYIVAPPKDDGELRETLLVALSRAALTQDFDREVTAALAAGEIGRAEAFVTVARQTGVALKPETVAAWEAATTSWAWLWRTGSDCAYGAATGAATSLTAVGCALALDLTPAGDVRDLTVQGGGWAAGYEPDYLILGLAVAGLGLTWYNLHGGVLAGGAHAAIGKSVLKTAIRGGATTAEFSRGLRRSIEAGVDFAGLKGWLRQGMPGGGEAAGRFVRRQSVDELGAVAGHVADLYRQGGAPAAHAALKAVRSADDLPLMARTARVMGEDGTSTLHVLGRNLRASIRSYKAGFKTYLAFGGWVSLALAGLASVALALSETLARKLTGGAFLSGVRHLLTQRLASG